MTALTKIEKPFGLLDKETQDALRAHAGSIEVFDETQWAHIDCPSFFPTHSYRAAPAKLPEWPAGLRPEWKWIAMEQTGEIWAYDTKPKIVDLFWSATGGHITSVDQLIDISFDGIPGEQAIIQRPEGV